MWWSTVSKAGDKSNNTSADRSPAWIPRRISDNTLSTAVSDEWSVLYADWSRGSKADFSKYAMSCFAAILSSSFDATDRLDIGLYDLTSPVSIPDFFTSRVMWVTLNASGTKPLNSDLLKRLVRNRAMTPTTALRCVVGCGSSAQVLSGNTPTAAMTSLTVTDWNWLNDAVEGFGEKDGGRASDVVDRTPATLSSGKRTLNS